EQHAEYHPVPEDLQEFLAEQEEEGPHRQVSLGLKLRTAASMNTASIAESTRSSTHTFSKPAPLSITPREITMNHRAGTTTVSGLNQSGRLAIGKIIPDSSVLGSMVPTIAPSIAARCDVVRAAISTPRARPTMAYSTLAESSSVRLPRNGTRNTSQAARSADTTLTIARNRYGTTLPTIICHGRSGDTSRTSSVPRSFSRDREFAVMSAVTSVRTSAMSPGTKRFTLSSAGL